MPVANESQEKKISPREAYDGPRLLHSRHEVCGMLGIGLTLCDELIADGTLEKVNLGRRVGITAASINRLANAR